MERQPNQMEKLSTSQDFILEVLIFTTKYLLRNETDLFNYRQKSKDPKGLGYDYFHLKLPKSSYPVFYFFHQSKKNIEEFWLEKRFQSESIFENYQEIDDYTLIGGIRIQWRRISGKNRLHIKFIAAKDIESRVYGTMRQEKSKSYPFFVVKTNKNEMELKKDQILKLGRVFLKIEEIVLDPSEGPLLKKEQILNLDEKEKDSPLDQPDFELKCRICHRESKSPDPTFVNPCFCKGSIQYICTDCLKLWLRKKAVSNGQRMEQANVHRTQILSCEVCKAKLPKLIIKNNQKYSLIQQINEGKKSPYMSLMMRTQTDLDTFSEQERLFVIADEKGTPLGRLEDEDKDKVIFDETTVSRDHARVEFRKTNEGPKMFIKDGGSMFGTLVYEKDFEAVLSNQMKEYQIGNSLFRLKIKRSR